MGLFHHARHRKSATRKVLSWGDQNHLTRYNHRQPEATLGALPRSPLTYFREVADDLIGRPLIEIERPPNRESSDDGVQAAAQPLVSRNLGVLRRRDVRNDDAGHRLASNRAFAAKLAAFSPLPK